MGNLFSNHIVKWGILAITTGVFIWDCVAHGFLSNYANAILPILMVYQLRGILWEEGMRNKIGDLTEKLKNCEQKR